MYQPIEEMPSLLGQIVKTPGSVRERFLNPIEPWTFWKFGRVENAHTKALVCGGIQVMVFKSVHHAHTPGMISCNLKIVESDYISASLLVTLGIRIL